MNAAPVSTRVALLALLDLTKMIADAVSVQAELHRWKTTDALMSGESSTRPLAAFLGYTGVAIGLYLTVAAGRRALGDA